ncbi:MAG: LD-carboxypeptidase, partial [Myxococcota bacterium]
SPFDESRFSTGIRHLEQLGFTVRLPEAIHARHGFLAGNDAHRAAAFKSAWLDPTVDVLMAARGGYGVHRLMPDITKLPPSPNRKLVVGFSDITAIHAWLYENGWPSIHGPVVTQLGDLADADLARLQTVLSGDWSQLSYSATGPTVNGGVARGKLFGGCLAVLTPMLGTPYAPDLRNAIVMLEDVAEAPYRIDRMLTHMLQAGALDGVAGIALGDFTGGHAVREGEPDAMGVLSERLGALGVPMVAGFPFGHGQHNHAVPLGVDARLDADAKQLIIEARHV